MRGARLLPLALIAACLCGGCQSIRSEARTITVSGTGIVSVTPDIATFSVRVEETSPTTSEALSGANRKMELVLSALKGMGVEDRDIATSALRLSPSYEWREGNRITTGQTSSQTLSVKVRDLDNLGSLIDQLGSIDGILLDSISFDKEEKCEAYSASRTLAIQDAYGKASTYAHALGMEVGRARSVSEGGESHDMVVMAKGAMLANELSSPTTPQSGVMEVESQVMVKFDLR